MTQIQSVSAYLNEPRKSGELPLGFVLFYGKRYAMRHYKQLSYEQRSQIEKSNKIGFSQAQIALTVGVNRSTISRELARSRGQRGYRDKQAQKFALSHREEARKVTKMIPELTNLVEDKLAEK